MSAELDKAKKAIEAIKKQEALETIIDRLENKVIEQDKPTFPRQFSATPDAIKGRLDLLNDQTEANLNHLIGQDSFTDYEQLNGNIENFIGFTQIPTGVIGPLAVKGTAANGNYYVPLATHEGALVASYHRGAKAISMSGGANSVCLTEGVQRSPIFRFKTLVTVGKFLLWVLENQRNFSEIVKTKSSHAVLEGMDTNIEGNHIILTFDYYTGDAAGQNMVTICTQAICDFILENCPFKPDYYFVESNYSGDKKASAISFSKVRGKKVTTEVVLSKETIAVVLKSTPKKMQEYWLSSTIAIVQSGAIGAQGHYANGLAALFMACGQDAACVSEASVGITRMEVTESGDLYACVTIPNLIVGTIRGGTHLPTQKECLSMIGCLGTGKARKFAEICGAVILAGELSIAAALSVGHFTRAHEVLGRKHGNGKK